MTSGGDYVAALAAGKVSEPGDPNPFVGRMALARLWMIGHQQMLSTRVASIGQPTN